MTNFLVKCFKFSIENAYSNEEKDYNYRLVINFLKDDIKDNLYWRQKVIPSSCIKSAKQLHDYLARQDSKLKTDKKNLKYFEKEYKKIKEKNND